MTKNERVTRRSVLASFLALAVCISMLVGTSYAWFTDSVTSSGNVIKSGKLDIEMYWADGKEDPKDTTANWQDASAGAIFKDDVLWEPGFVQVRHINIKNVGNLAFKYKFAIVANGTLDTNANGHTLADAIDVYYVDPAVQISTRDLLTDAYKLNTLTNVLANIASANSTAQGVLYPAGKEPAGGKSQETVTIALKMREDAGNEYQNMSLGTDFSVQVLATQYTFEKDTFDDQYDDGLTPVEQGLNIVEKDGVQYLYGDDGSVTLYCVTANYQGNSFTIPNNVTRIGNYAFAYNPNVETVTVPSSVKDLGRGFDSSSVKHVILSEGLEKISDRAFNKTRQLESITIPSTVTEIEPYAFQLSGVQELYIPANVTTIGKGALSSCPNLKKITIAGDPVQIGTYVARPSPVLEEVHILGENVTFEAGSMTFTNGENGNASAIAIYVKNETVKNRLLAASGSSVSYGMNIILPASVAVGGVNMPVSHTFKDSLSYTGSQVKTASLETAEDFAALSAMYQNGMVAAGEGNAITITLTQDVDLDGVAFVPFGGQHSTFNGNNHTISNMNAVQNGLGKSGLIAYGGGWTINDLTLLNPSAKGCQAGAFYGQTDGGKLNNCTIAGNVSITWEQCSSSYNEEWNAVGAFVGWSGVDEPCQATNLKVADNTSITIVKTGMAAESAAGALSLQSDNVYIGAGGNANTLGSAVSVGANVTTNVIE